MSTETLKKLEGILTTIYNTMQLYWM